MLALTRKEGEAVLMSGGIKIVVGGINAKTGVVKLRIKAPKNITILRDELLEKATEETKADLTSFG